MAARFEIQSPKAGEYRWVLLSQGRTLATSESYGRRGLAEKAIVSFRMAAVNAPVIDTTRPAAATPTGKAARATGRAVAKAVVKGGRAVEKVETTAATAAKKGAGAVEKAVVKTKRKAKKGKAGKTKRKR